MALTFGSTETITTSERSDGPGRSSVANWLSSKDGLKKCPFREARRDAISAREPSKNTNTMPPSDPPRALLNTSRYERFNAEHATTVR